MGTGQNVAKISRGLGRFLPRRDCRIQPGVSTPGTVPPRRRAPKGRKNEPLREGRGRLTPIDEAELGPVDGVRILHLQCHFGRDSLILWIYLTSTPLASPPLQSSLPNLP
jgi:hypothetical protein